MKSRSAKAVSIDDDRYESLVEGIYDAALDAELWPSLLKDIGSAFKSHLTGFFVQTHDNRIGESLFDGLDPDMAQRYDKYYGAINPWFTTPDLMLPGRVSTDSTLEEHSGNKRALLDTEFYQDYCRPADLRHIMGSCLREFGGDLFNFTFHRTARAGYFSAHEISMYRRLSRHLMKASLLGHQLSKAAAEQDSREFALDRLRIGVVTVDQQERIQYMNRYARGLIEAGTTLYECDVRLGARPKRNASALQIAISKATLQCESSSIYLWRGGKSPLSACVMPCGESRKLDLLCTPRRLTAIFICDPDDKALSNAETIARLWNLTQRESDIAVRLASGQLIKQIAAELNMSHQTAQWYCKQILHKAGVRRQTELCIKLLKETEMFVDAIGPRRK